MDILDFGNEWEIKKEEKTGIDYYSATIAKVQVNLWHDNIITSVLNQQNGREPSATPEYFALRQDVRIFVLSPVRDGLRLRR